MTTSEVWPIFRLAGPVLLSRAGAILIVTIDVAMCGYAGSNELAFYGLANGPQVSMILIGIGSILPIVILTAGADGAGKHRRCGQIFLVGLTHALALGILLGILMQFGEVFFQLTGQSAALSEGSGPVLAMHGLGLGGLLCMVAASLFLEGLQRPVPAMVVTLGSNVVNFYLNWVFIFGNHGAPEMGAEGAALATSITRWASFLVLAIYILRTFDLVKYGIKGPITQFRAISKRLRRLGYPTAIAHGMESASFLIMTLFAGYMGVLQTAVWTIGFNLITIAFMVALGYAMAASVLVANHLGQKKLGQAAVAGWTASTLAIITLILLAILFLFIPEHLARIYTNDPDVLLLATPVIFAASFIMVLDGIQAVAVGILRGYQNMWYITMSLVTSFWGVMVPLGWYFGLYLDGGPIALMWSVGAACIVAIALLFGRFRFLEVKIYRAKKDLHRKLK